MPDVTESEADIALQWTSDRPKDVELSQVLTPSRVAALCLLGLAVGLAEPWLMPGRHIQVPNEIFGLVGIAYSWTYLRQSVSQELTSGRRAWLGVRACFWPLSLPLHFLRRFGWRKGMGQVGRLFLLGLAFSLCQLLGIAASL